MSPDSLSNPQDSDRTQEFIALHSRHARWIYGYLVSLVHNHADAEDLFGYTAGLDLEAAPPLTAFDADDSEGFITEPE